MRIALLYPPPWKLAHPGELPHLQDGAPTGFREGDLDADFYQIPYGLLSLAAVATEAGHQVKVWNLSAFSWQRVREVIAALDAEVFGLSMWTANRRGVRLMAQEIRRVHPQARIVCGGPHATALPEQVLQHIPELDCVFLGESEASFLELLGRAETGASITGIPGTVVREAQDLRRGPARPLLADLDQLPPPSRYYSTHIAMTSRGCPWSCTFCGAETSWGRGFRAFSVPYVVDMLESALARLPVRILQIKDDTFTTNKKRVLAICREIERRQLKFLFSCDTRVDVLDEELLIAMRRAGCQRLSLGVESGSPTILRNIDKRITAEDILEATRLAKSVGIQVRYYMMLGNRGETRQTLQETLEFLAQARPHQYVFSCLSIYPGTRDYQAALAAGRIAPEVYLHGDFQELKLPFDADEATTRDLVQFFEQNRGLRTYHWQTVQEAEAVMQLLGPHPSVALDLSAALLRAGRPAEAEARAREALALGTPVPGLARNLIACARFAQGDLEATKEEFMLAARTDPQHPNLMENIEKLRAWFKVSGPERGLALSLEAHTQFLLLERTVQPCLPGPLPADFAVFAPAAAIAAPGPAAS